MKMLYNFDEFLNEAFQQQAVNNQRSMQNTVEKIADTKQKIADSMRKMQDLKDRAQKSTDDITKAVFQAKIASVNARRESYVAYIQYLQAMQTFYQVKAKEIEAAEKNTKKPK